MAEQHDSVWDTCRDIVCSWEQDCPWDRQRRRDTEQLQLKWEKRVAGRGWLCSGPWADRVGGCVYKSAVLSAD